MTDLLTFFPAESSARKCHHLISHIEWHRQSTQVRNKVHTDAKQCMVKFLNRDLKTFFYTVVRNYHTLFSCIFPEKLTNMNKHFRHCSWENAYTTDLKTLCLLVVRSPYCNDIVMMLEDIFAYTSSETGWIWKKLGREMGWEKSKSIQFLARSLQSRGSQRKQLEMNSFSLGISQIILVTSPSSTSTKISKNM